MRPVRRLALSSAAALALALVAADGADGTCASRELESGSGPVTAEVCELQTWFADDGSHVHVGSNGAGTPTWTVEEPATFTGGNGGMTVGGPASIVSTAGGAAQDAAVTFDGTFTGALDVMDVTLHVAYTGYASTGNPTGRSDFSAQIGLVVDGEQILIPGGYLIDDVTTNETGTPGVFELRFAITGLASALEDFDLELDGEHAIQLLVAGNYVNTQPVSVFLYGAAEVPGGIVFNPVELDLESTTEVDVG